MGRQRRGERNQTCVLGHPIARELIPNRLEWQRPGPCQACGAPVHSPLNSGHGCAYIRPMTPKTPGPNSNARRQGGTVVHKMKRLRLCCDCAVAYDFVTQGYTRILGRGLGFNADEWAAFMSTLERGLKAARA